MNFLKIKETCLYIRDLEKAKAFYHGVLGLSIISYVEAKHIFFRVGTSVLLCFNPEDSKMKKSPPAHFGSGKQHFAFEVAKEIYGQTKRELESKGIKITDSILWPSGVESFYFEDPENNILEVVPDEGVWE
jgi:catechol 2,3-dioxygenase-like lactoylglutathione lyase family enzyme